MATDTRSTHKNLQVPDPANDVNEDFVRIGEAIEAIGTLIHLVEQDLADKAADDHDHMIGDVQGLQAALDALNDAVSGLSTPGLNDLGDVDVSSATNGMVLLYVGSAWQAAKIAAANVTFGSENSVADELTAIDNAIASLSAALGQKADASSLGALASKDQVGTGDLNASEVKSALGLGYETRVFNGKAQFNTGSTWKNIDVDAIAAAAAAQSKADSNETAIAAVVAQTHDVDQTWQDLLGARSQGVTYQNTTGQPILVLIAVNDSSASRRVEVSPDNSVFSILGSLPSGASQWSFRVQSGHYYRLTSGGGGIANWLEFR